MQITDGRELNLLIQNKTEAHSRRSNENSNSSAWKLYKCGLPSVPFVLHSPSATYGNNKFQCSQRSCPTAARCLRMVQQYASGWRDVRFSPPPTHRRPSRRRHFTLQWNKKAARSNPWTDNKSESPLCSLLARGRTHRRGTGSNIFVPYRRVPWN